MVNSFLNYYLNWFKLRATWFDLESILNKRTQRSSLELNECLIGISCGLWFTPIEVASVAMPESIIKHTISPG